MIITGLVVSTTSSVLLKASQAFFFFFLSLPLYEDNLDAWIDDDGFKDNPQDDKSKSYLFDELSLAKEDFKKFLDSNEYMNSSISNAGGARKVHQYINAYTIRIRKIRLMIEFTTYFNTSQNKYGSKYLMAKCCWINSKNGKVIKKFSKVVGLDELVRVNGKVSKKIEASVKKELEISMWKEYSKEYLSIPKLNKTI